MRDISIPTMVIQISLKNKVILLVETYRSLLFLFFVFPFIFSSSGMGMANSPDVPEMLVIFDGFHGHES